MLYIIGLGLRDGDIAQRGISALEQADTAYAELYTNAVKYDLDALEERTGTKITKLERHEVEDEDRILEDAQEQDVAFLVSGDPLTATTHQDILFRARQQGIETQLIHAPSILTAVTETGLSIYKFGRTTTLPEPYNDTVPDSPFDVVADNREQGLHTLMLLDIGMTADDALGIVGNRFSADEEVIVCAELGTEHGDIRLGTVSDLQAEAGNMGVPASIIVPGALSDHEQERVEQFRT